MTDEYLDVDLNNLRVKEIEEIEELTGIPFDESFQPGKPKAKTLRAIGYVIKKRDDPTFTFEDAGELIIRVPDQETDPTDAAD